MLASRSRCSVHRGTDDAERRIDAEPEEDGLRGPIEAVLRP